MPETFTPAERDLLRLVLDRLVPADGNFPGAGDLGVAAYLERVAGGAPPVRRLFVEGLRQIAITAERIRPDGFAALTGDERDAVLRDLERDRPEFFEILVRQTYAGYYSNASVLRLLGEEGAPQPRGHLLDPFAPNVVDRVKQSAYTYRHP